MIFLDIPLYKHNCATCHFLGNEEIHGEIVDMYYCNSLNGVFIKSKDGTYTKKYQVESLARDFYSYYLYEIKIIRKAFHKAMEQGFLTMDQKGIVLSVLNSI